MNKKTEYVLLTRDQFDVMRTALYDYQQQHAEAYEQLHDDESPVCPCKACTYARQANIAILNFLLWLLAAPSGNMLGDLLSGLLLTVTIGCYLLVREP